ncbi:MAG: 50S ribosomal protein L15 [Polyangiaceae bacterium]|jgi:large subunit ribosomal protein L15|nr:50S ribosomal protein L15 [Polyangiaceae bacterium]MBK8938110.1 50S ribosomal protein L15 [Polyangiaceae bacterium]
MDILSKLQAPEGANKKSKRVGRGPGSGNGKTAGRGQKGQKARSKGNINKKHFQGGQTPIQRRLPKRGFRNPLATPVVAVNIGDLESVFDSGATVDLAALHGARLVQGKLTDFQKARSHVKVLGDGELTKKLTVSAHRFSKSAVEKIQAAGGSVVELPRVPQAEKKAEAAKA